MFRNKHKSGSSSRQQEAAATRHDYQKAEEFIAPLNMNGLQGRMLRAPSTHGKKSEILLVYGHHAQLERWWGLVENLRHYGTVTMPDLPGFGGMESFRNIGQAPTIDNFADYLAAFIRLRYKRRRIAIVAISFGFVVVTRMLQRYPELAKKIDLLVCLVGFMHHDDFLMKPRHKVLFRVLTRIFALRPVSFLIRYTCLNGPIIRNVYARMDSGKRRLSTLDPVESRVLLDYEVKLWQINDVSTHWATNHEFLSLDNCRQQIDLPVWHVASLNDHYLDAELTKQHMLIVFSDYNQALINAKAHTPNLNANAEEMAVMLPDKLRKALSQLG
jgi:pimeloyl-ACP methyl ester carboxylesterase